MHTSNLPLDQQQMLHPEFLTNEQSYLRLRDSLLREFQGQWGDKVVAAGTNLLEVMDRASQFGGRPYVALVGREDEVVFRVRRTRRRWSMARKNSTATVGRKPTVKKQMARHAEIAATIAEIDRIKPPDAKAAKVIALIRSWLCDESGYDEETWPQLKKALNRERDRVGARRLFDD